MSRTTRWSGSTERWGSAPGRTRTSSSVPSRAWLASTASTGPPGAGATPERSRRSRAGKMTRTSPSSCRSWGVTAVGQARTRRSKLGWRPLRTCTVAWSGLATAVGVHVSNDAVARRKGASLARPDGPRVGWGIRAPSRQDSVEVQELIGARPQPVRRWQAVGAGDDEADVAEVPHRSPDTLELLDEHRPGAEGRVGQQHAVALAATEDDEVAVAALDNGREDRRPLLEVTQLELAEALAAIAAVVDVALQVEQREAQAGTDQHRVGEVLVAPHQAERHLALAHRVAVLEVQKRGQRGRPAAQVPALQDHPLGPHLRQRADDARPAPGLRVGAGGQQASQQEGAEAAREGNRKASGH